MNLTFSTLSCPTWNLSQVLTTAVEYQLPGIDFRGLGAEIDITQLPEFNSHLDQTLDQFKQNKLSMPCLNTSVTLVCPSPERWDAMLDEANRYARLAQRTGTSMLRIFGGAIPKGLSHDEGRSMAQRHLRQIVKICNPHNCIPILETHDHWATSQSVLELIHEFDPADVGVLWDLEHPWRNGEAPIDTARGLKRYIRHVHVKDTADKGADRRPVLLGQGVLPLADCATALGDINFDGWYCLEVEKRWDASAPDPEVSLPQFSRYMRETWNR